MINYPIYIGENALENLSSFLKERQYSNMLVLVDENTGRDCYPRFKGLLPPHEKVEIPAGEIHKNLNTCTKVWAAITEKAFDRRGLVLNLGGGVIGDMGGFIAGTYKRGIDFIQIPTTLLSQVDASVGGKLGIDFQGFKNHIGLFREPQAVVIWPPFLETLPEREILSGMAEVIKHHIIADADAWNILKTIIGIQELDFEALIRHSIEIKSQIVEADPFEKGIRKALNFGHTIGHAVESYFLESETPLLHGEAIAIGMIAESWIARETGLISTDELEEIEKMILKLYGSFPIPESTFSDITALTQNDKKNQDGKILCTLPDGIGKVKVNVEISPSQIENSLRYYSEIIS